MITGDVRAIKHDGFNTSIDDLDPREDYPKPKSMEQTEEVDISEKGRTTRIRMLPNHNQKEEMAQFLRKNLDDFAWSAAKMPGIPPSVISHALNVNPEVRPVKLK